MTRIIQLIGGILLALFAAEVVLRLLPLPAGVLAAEPSRDWPARHMVPNTDTTMSFAWNLANVQHGHVNNAGFSSPFDYKHGAYLIINHGWRWLRERLGLSLISGVPARALGWAITMLGIVIAWVFFRATTIDGALAMLHAMAGATPQVDQLAGREQAWLLLAALTAFVVILPNSQTLILGRLKPAIERRASAAPWPIWVGLGGWTVAVCWLALVAASRENSAFIYFNF